MNKYIITALAILLFQLVILTGLSYATTPLISSVSGAIQTGQTITISGSNLMSEVKTNWIPMFASGTAYGFEGSSPTADGYVHGSPGVYDATVKLSGSKSYKFSVTGAGSSEISSADSFYTSGLSEYYMRGYCRWDGSSWPSTYIKMWLTQNYNASPNIYLQPQEGSSFPTQFRLFDIYDGSNTYQSIPSGQLQSGRWYCIELHVNSSTRRVDVWIDGTQIFTNLSKSLTTQQDNDFNFGIVNANGLASGQVLTHYEDNLAMSTSRIYPSSKIEVSNNSTYGSGTVVYQEQVFLSDSSVQVKLNLTGLGSGPYYLWVTNNAQGINSAYQLGSGTNSTTDTTAPSTPTGLSVQILP